MHVLLLMIAGLVLWPILHRRKGIIKGKVICRNCGSTDKAVIISPSNFTVELLLWCSGVLPGVIYTLWCNYVAYNACAKCASRDIVPIDSPVGRTLAMQHSPTHVAPISEQMGRQ